MDGFSLACVAPHVESGMIGGVNSKPANSGSASLQYLGLSWTSLAGHRGWLQTETQRLIHFSVGSVHPEGGFAWLDGDGNAVLDRPVETWITTRMTHVLSLGVLLGIPGCGPLVDHGVTALQTLLADEANGGWYSASDQPNQGEKRAYEQAFVLLAASSATLADRRGAEQLLAKATQTVMERFWDEGRGVVRDVAVRDWSSFEPYGGANANMHMLEAFLAVADVTGDSVWLDRGLRIAAFFIDTRARARNWRIPEHFNAYWKELPEYNREDPAHKFRPYGSTVGHGFEWSRLCLHLHASLEAAGLANSANAWLPHASRSLFDRAASDGWQGDGFLYTTDWDGQPVVEDRLHWVVCEAIAAAAALYRTTGNPDDENRYRQWWDLAERSFIDRSGGSWWAQLDANNHPATSVWSGKPDTYHAVQATLLPRLPLAPSLASAIARGLLDS
jgi:sulfoquinovose isomerase